MGKAFMTGDYYLLWIFSAGWSAKGPTVFMRLSANGK